MGANTPSFDDALQVIEQLSIEEQEDLIDIVRRRVAEVNRQRLIDRVREAEQEYKDGKYSPATVEEIMREILE
jgi:DNA-binding TFAR19-related protein (PDSD5 family)